MSRIAFHRRISMNIVPCVSSLNSLFRMPSSTLYYYRNSFHRTLARCFSHFKDFYRYLFDSYKVDWTTAREVTKEELDQVLLNEFSIKQRWYMDQVNDGTLKHLVKLYLHCQKLSFLCETADFVAELPDKRNEEDLNLYAKYIGDLVGKCDNALSDLSNKSSTSTSILGFITGGYFITATTSSLSSLNGYLDQITTLLPKFAL